MSENAGVIGYTAGVWDQLHGGHIRLLMASRRLCEVLIVGVVSDHGTWSYKGHYPVESSQVRTRHLEQLALSGVVLVPQKGTDPSENLERFRPDFMSHGSDWTQLREGHETLERLGIRFVTLPYTPGISSTMLRERRSAFIALNGWPNVTSVTR